MERVAPARAFLFLVFQDDTEDPNLLSRHLNIKK